MTILGLLHVVLGGVRTRRQRSLPSFSARPRSSNSCSAWTRPWTALSWSDSGNATFSLLVRLRAAPGGTLVSGSAQIHATENGDLAQGRPGRRPAVIPPARHRWRPA